MKKALYIFVVLSSVIINAEKIRVACIGDSITFGSGIANRDVDSYPVKLQKLLGKKFEVRNFGNPGRCIIKSSMRGSTKRSFIFMKEHTAALEFKPDVVICNLGINDVMDYPTRSEQFIPDYKSLLETYRALPTNPKIWIWGPLAPLYPGQSFYGKPVVEDINGAIIKVADELNKESNKKNYKLAKHKRLPKVQLLNLEKPLSGMPQNFPDHIHPNSTGTTIIAETIFNKSFKSYKKK